jgi:hypothetical protein
LLFQAVEQFMDWIEESVLYFHSSRGIQPPESGLFGIPENLKTTLFQYAYVYLLFIIWDKVNNKNNMQIYINNIGINKEK